MIHRIAKNSKDKRILSRIPVVDRKSGGENFDYDRVIVKKPWGYEYLVYENEHAAIWMLHIVRKRRTSMHAHVNKKTALILLSGSAHSHSLNGRVKLSPLDCVMMGEGVFHATEAFSSLEIEPQSENGIWVMEIETPPLKTDLVRIKDDYGRKGVSYEGQDRMVFDPKQSLKLVSPPKGRTISRKFQDCMFSIGCAERFRALPAGQKGVLISVIAKEKGLQSKNRCLQIGEISTLEEFAKSTEGTDLEGYTALMIEREKTNMKLSDYIFSFIADSGIKEVFAVCGGGAMHLVDSCGRNERLKYIAVHHEQAAAMAAEAYARISGSPGAALVTSGPGGTNTITGLVGAWIDSIPVIFVSGQVTGDTLIKDTGLRQFGIQEADITDIVRPITKYAVTVTDPATIRYHLEKALYLAVSGRPGPVWLDIPLDVQSKLVCHAQMRSFKPPAEEKTKERGIRAQIRECIRLLKKARRPVLICGYGVRLAKAERELRRLIERLNIPVVSSWTGSDLIPFEHGLFIGRSGIMGDRAGNFTVQNSDLLLIIGSRMSIPQVGYNYATFAREAKKIMVDIDDAELRKPSLKPDLPIKADAGEFIRGLITGLEESKAGINAGSWLKRCRGWKKRYPVVLPEYGKLKDKVNSFYFIDVLSKKLGPDAVVVTDMGTSFTCTMQTFKVKEGQRLFTSSGHASMGFGLPGAIGACFASGKKKTICISGDGGLQMNIQELQTVVHNKLPIILFVLNNSGYLSIKLMQQNHFGKYVGSEPDSGVSCPDIIKVGAAYGIGARRIRNNKELHAHIDEVLSEKGPYICEIMMPENQQLIPRVSSLKKPDGTITAKPLEDLYPFLSREEFMANMIVKPIEILKE